MFIRVKNLSANQELNINTRNIVSFGPAGDPKHSVMSLADGSSFTVDKSNRSLRHAVTEAQRPFRTEALAD
jgi:hypothetical protein